ncbi:hypothetical protein LTR17_014405 [Elasticomyces elasticus]|nr:hypothetical protein LTR17_014405 [Elasticomyces elasticus]
MAGTSQGLGPGKTLPNPQPSGAAEQNTTPAPQESTLPKPSGASEQKPTSTAQQSTLPKPSGASEQNNNAAQPQGSKSKSKKKGKGGVPATHTQTEAEKEDASFWAGLNQQNAKDKLLAAHAALAKAEADSGKGKHVFSLPGSKPSGSTPSGSKPAPEKPAAEKPAAEKPAAEKPAAEKPAAEKPAAEKPAAEKPAPEKPAPEKPAPGKPSPPPASGSQVGPGNGAAPAHPNWKAGCQLPEASASMAETVEVMAELNSLGWQPMDTLQLGQQKEKKQNKPQEMLQCGLRALAGGDVNAQNPDPNQCPVNRRCREAFAYGTLKGYPGGHNAVFKGHANKMKALDETFDPDEFEFFSLSYLQVMLNTMADPQCNDKALKYKVGLLQFQRVPGKGDELYLDCAQWAVGRDIPDPDRLIFIRNIRNVHWEYYAAVVDPAETSVYPSARYLDEINDPRTCQQARLMEHMKSHSDATHACTMSMLAAQARKTQGGASGPSKEADEAMEDAPPVTPATDGSKEGAQDSSKAGAQGTSKADKAKAKRFAALINPVVATFNQFDVLRDDEGVEAMIQKYTSEAKAAGPQLEEKIVPLGELPKNLKYRESAALYPSFLAIDEEKKFCLDRVFEYRGTDVPSDFSWGSGKKKGNVYGTDFAMVQFHGTDVQGDGVFGWPNAQAGDANLDKRILKMSFIPESQMPCFSYKIAHPDRKNVRVEFYPGQLTRTNDSVGVKFSHGADPGVGENMPNHQILTDLSMENQLFRTDLELWAKDNAPNHGAASDPVWYGITVSEIEELCKQYDVDHTHMSYADKMIVHFHRTRSFSTYREEKRPEALKLLPAFASYMTALCYATAHYGYSWWYSVVGNCSLDSAEYPWSNEDGKWLPFPRWLVTHFKVTMKDGKAIDCVPSKIKPFTPLQERVFPDGYSSAWHGRLAMAREVQKNGADLDDLVEKLRGKIACRLIPCAEDKAVYFGALRFEGLPKGAADIVMPELKRRCFLAIRHNGQDIDMRGTVCEDAFDTGAHCCVLLQPTDSKSPLITQEGNYSASMDFEHDIKSQNRCMNAILRLQNGHARKMGVSLPNICLSAPVPADAETNWFSQRFSPKEQILFMALLKKQGLNESQFQAGMHAMKTKDGLSLIWGPPGTGKTTGCLAIILALLVVGWHEKLDGSHARGNKILVTASSNGAVKAASKAFAKANTTGSVQIKDSEWCRFVGAHFDVDWRGAQGTDLVGDMEKTFGKFNVDGEGNEDADAEMADAGSKANWADESNEEAEKNEREMKARMYAAVQDSIKTAGEAEDGTAHDDEFSVKKLKYLKNYATGDASKWYPDKPLREAELALNAMDYMRVCLERRALDRDGADRQTRAECISRFMALDQFWTKEFLGQCKLVFCTNNTSCHEALMEYFRPNILLIDEAGFSSPPDAMVPMASNDETLLHVFLVGDHQQLKPVVMSKGVNEAFEGVAESLFEKHFENRHVTRDTAMFNIQYRQHPDNAAFTAQVYPGLLNGASTYDDNDVRKAFRTMMSRVSSWNRRFRVAVNCTGFSGIYPGTASSCNFSEAKTALNVALHQIKAGIPASGITIMTPYSGQVRLINKLQRASTNKKLEGLQVVHVKSINDMLGHQAESVILSFVKHHKDDPMQLGFIYLRAFEDWVNESLGLADKQDFMNRDDTKLFKSLVDDCFAKKDIIDQDDLEQALSGGKPTPTGFYDRVRPRAPTAKKGNKRPADGYGADQAQPNMPEGSKRRHVDDTPANEPAPPPAPMGNFVQPARGGRGGRGRGRGGDGGRGGRGRGRGRGT